MLRQADLRRTLINLLETLLGVRVCTIGLLIAATIVFPGVTPGAARPFFSRKIGRLGSELVFVGDGGATEPNDATRHCGAEATLFWTTLSKLRLQGRRRSVTSLEPEFALR